MKNDTVMEPVADAPVIRLQCTPERLDAAVQAAQYGMNEMPHKDAIVKRVGQCFHVKKTKSGISVRQLDYPAEADQQ